MHRKSQSARWKHWFHLWPFLPTTPLSDFHSLSFQYETKGSWQNSVLMHLKQRASEQFSSLARECDSWFKGLVFNISYLTCYNKYVIKVAVKKVSLWAFMMLYGVLVTFKGLFYLKTIQLVMQISLGLCACLRKHTFPDTALIISLFLQHRHSPITRIWLPKIIHSPIMTIFIATYQLC